MTTTRFVALLLTIAMVTAVLTPIGVASASTADGSSAVSVAQEGDGPNENASDRAFEAVGLGDLIRAFVADNRDDAQHWGSMISSFVRAHNPGNAPEHAGPPDHAGEARDDGERGAPDHAGGPDEERGPPAHAGSGANPAVGGEIDGDDGDK